MTIGNNISFDASSGKYFFVRPDGKRCASADLGYVASTFARTYEEHFRTQGTFQLETNGESQGDVGQDIKEFTINERFDFISDYVNMVCSWIQPSMIITGSGGLGKSTTVMKALKDNLFVDATTMTGEEHFMPRERYKVIKGYSTAKSLYRSLYENKNSVLVFDDCDSVLRDETAVNLLKGALDTCDERIISWNSEMSDDLPKTFRFEGAVIFISNLNKERIPQALRTRSVCVDVSMTMQQKLERMETIVGYETFMPEIDTNIKKDAMDAVKKYAYIAGEELSMRTLVQAIRTRIMCEGQKFEDLLQYSMAN